MLMLFHFQFVQGSGWKPAMCVRDSGRSLSLLQSEFLREEPAFLSLPHFSIFLSSLYDDFLPLASYCLSPSAPSPWSPTCQETVSSEPSWALPVQYAPGPQARTHPLPSPGLFPLPGSPFPHSSTFCDKRHHLSLGDSSLATSSHP